MQNRAGVTVVRKFTGGVWGAWLVRDRLRHDAVLKCIWGVDWRPRLSTAAKVVDEFRDRGGPAPRYVHYGYREWERGRCRSGSRDAPSSS
jgi:hypothetical protein